MRRRPGAAGKKTISTAGLYVDRVPAEEWAQIFDEVWRRYRDFFYAKNMHGYDWEALRTHYRPLLKDVSHRSDLNYVISEMIAELSVQHAYIDGGDYQIPPRPKVALPGARFELDKESNRFRIAKIFDGENEEDIYRSPLTEIGVDAKVGDYVLAVNGHELTGKDDPYRLLRNIADNPVALTLNSKPETEGSRTVTYRPITDESNLLYLDWVTQNRKMVDELSGGRVGYIHVPDMGAAGIREFIKWYYPQMRKEGLVVDVRANGGGNVSRMLIERLRRKLLAMQYLANSGPADHLSGCGIYRADGVPAERELGVGWGHLPGDVQGGGTRSAHRQAVMGRRGGNHKPRAVNRRRQRECAGVRVRQRGRAVDHRGSWSGSRH